MDAASSTASATTLTTGTLILIGIAMLCAIGIIWWGTMLRRRRAAAVAIAEEHAALAGHAPEVDGEAIEEAPLPPGDSVESLVEPAPIAMAPAVVPQAIEPAAPVAPPPTPAPSTAPQAATHPLTSLKGLGPKAAAALAAQGIDSVDQLAALSPDDAAALDSQLGALAGRIARDRWVEQARLLAAGDVTGFEKAFGKLGA